jgi:hypothetical protein
VVSASSPYHSTRRPNTTLLGVIKVGARDRDALVGAADRLAALTEPPLPPGWDEELERKAARWRLRLAHDGAVEAGEVSADSDGEPSDAGDPAALEDPGDELATDAGAAQVILSAADQEEFERRLAVIRGDAVSLLLVGLVRANVHIVNSFLRSLFWSRPLSAAAAAEAAEEIERDDEDRVLLESAVKGSDGFFTTFFVSPYSKYIARWAAHRGLTPNAVTAVSMTIGVLAAAAFALGTRLGLVAGALLLQLAFTADCVDGQLARYTRTFSKLGAWLDSMLDRAKEYVVFAGLALGASRFGGDEVWALALAAMTLQTIRHTLDFSYGTLQHKAIAERLRPPVEEPRDWIRPVSAPGAAAAGGDGTAPTRAGAKPASAPGASPSFAPTDEPREPLSVPAVVRGVMRLSRAVERWRATRWLKKILVFPIGERFAVISLTAALTTPRTTFVVVLAWGTFALLYSLAGRSLRSLLS